MLVLGYTSALFMGAILGLVGGGGSILTVPILVYLLAVEPKMATAYSLFVVGVASLFGTWTYAKRGLVDFRTGAVFAVPAFIGVYSVRKFLMPALPSTLYQSGDFLLTLDSMILLSFAVVMLLAAVSMLRKPKLKDEAEDLNSTASTRSAKTKKLNYPLVGLEGIIVGAFTGFVGAGGGFIIIPALVVLAGLEIKVAIGTSLVIIAVKSLIGFLGDVQSSASVIDWQLLAIFTSISVVGIFLGGILSQKIPSTKLKPGFGWFVLLMGIGMLVKELA